MTPAASPAGVPPGASELAAARRRGRRGHRHRAVLPAGRPRAGGARRARPTAVGLARRASLARRALRVRVRHRRVRRRDPVDPLLRLRGHRPAARGARGARSPRRVRWSPRSPRRGLASPFLTAAVWVVLEALRGRFPFGGFPWADLGVALHDVPAARALASVGGTLLVTFVIVAVNGLVLDLVLASAFPRRAGRGAGGGRHRRGRGRRPWSPTSPASSRRPPATSAVAMLQGDDEQLPLAAADRPAPHREALRARRQPARPLRPHRVPRVGARHRSGAGPGAAGADRRRSPRTTARTCS